MKTERKDYNGSTQVLLEVWLPEGTEVNDESVGVALGKAIMGGDLTYFEGDMAEREFGDES